MCKGKDLTCTLTPITNIKNLDFSWFLIPLENEYPVSAPSNLCDGKNSP